MLTNGWRRPKIDPLLPKFIAVQYLFRARYNICGANSFIALLHLFSSWCVVAKRRGGGFYLSSHKWCDPVVRIISVLVAYARAARRCAHLFRNNSAAKNSRNFVALARSRLRTIGTFHFN